MKKREERRDRTIRVGERRRKRHLARIHPTGPVDCVCEFSPWKFAKSTGLGCPCRGRRFGAPKTGCGMCTGGSYAYRPAVDERIAGKRACRIWTAEAQAGYECSDGARTALLKIWP